MWSWWTIERGASLQIQLLIIITTLTPTMVASLHVSPRRVGHASQTRPCLAVPMRFSPAFFTGPQSVRAYARRRLQQAQS
jgi:hypothetical protein